MKALIIILSLAINSVIANSNDNHFANYNSKAKMMIENGEKYHQNVNTIRKMHPEFMKHKRDQTLRQGVRTEKASLKACVNCHGDNLGNLRIDSKDQFCSTCHQKVGTSIDCFGCHRATLQEK